MEPSAARVRKPDVGSETVRSSPPLIVTRGTASASTVTLRLAVATPPRKLVTVTVNSSSELGGSLPTDRTEGRSGKYTGLLMSLTRSAVAAGAFKAVTLHTNVRPRPLERDADKRRGSHLPMLVGPSSTTVGTAGFWGGCTNTHWVGLEATPPTTANTPPAFSCSTLGCGAPQGVTPADPSKMGTTRSGSAGVAPPNFNSSVVLVVHWHWAPKPSKVVSNTVSQGAAPEEPATRPDDSPSNTTNTDAPSLDITADWRLGGALRPDTGKAALGTRYSSLSARAKVLASLKLSSTPFHGAELAYATTSKASVCQ